MDHRGKTNQTESPLLLFLFVLMLTLWCSPASPVHLVPGPPGDFCPNLLGPMTNINCFSEVGGVC